jgi:formate hydrogenlyase transcriptional activator
MTAQKADLRPDLENRLRFESLLADLSSRFVNLEPGEVHRGIEDAQRRVCECLELDLSSLWLWSAENPYDLTLAHLISATDHDLTI